MFHPSLATLVPALEEQRLSIAQMCRVLRNDPRVSWAAIYAAEKAASQNWVRDSKRWRFDVVKRHATPALHQHGGDRCSPEWQQDRGLVRTDRGRRSKGNSVQQQLHWQVSSELQHLAELRTVIEQRLRELPPLLAAAAPRPTILQKKRMRSPETAHRETTPTVGCGGHDDDPASIWRQFQRRLPIMALYRTDWSATAASALMERAPLPVRVGGPPPWSEALTLPDIGHRLQWPTGLAAEVPQIALLAERLFPKEPWSDWIRYDDQAGSPRSPLTVRYAAQAVPWLQRAALLIQGFHGGSRGCASHIWRAMAMQKFL